MFNAGVVNGDSMCSPRAGFCDFFLVSGRIPHSKNPVKYRNNLPVNLMQAWNWATRQPMRQALHSNINAVCPPLGLKLHARH
jgi:hypothetical protein